MRVIEIRIFRSGEYRIRRDETEIGTTCRKRTEENDGSKKKVENKHSQPNVAGRQRHANLTFLGGRIARADLGVIET
jgi:hypothetical protein